MIRPGLATSLRRLRPRRERPTQRVALALAVLTLVLGTFLSIEDNNTNVKVAGVVVIVLVFSSLLLSTSGMLVLCFTVVLCLLAVFWIHGFNATQLSASGFVMIGVAGAVGVLQARRRDRLGLKQMSAESVIALIRDRLSVQSEVPALPDGWRVEVEQVAADGAAIAGDFVSNRLVCDERGQVLHLAVIDVSGSGIAAGPRALLLSGAVGGLLGSVPPESFLPAANDYLSRQRWSHGFASAVYLRLDLSTGEYGVRLAGHPPALHVRPTENPPWRASTATGTVLGVLPTLSTELDSGVLLPGESLVLYTDGVVEDRTRDIDVGTAMLAELVARLLSSGMDAGIARRVIEQVPRAQSDDRTVVLISRRGQDLIPAEVTAGRGFPGTEQA